MFHARYRRAIEEGGRGDARDHRGSDQLQGRQDESSDDPDETQAGIAAVIETIQKNYVRPDESNRAQSLVQQKGKHKFIDKIHVRYVESEKRHWAEMENFNSRRIAINESFYRNNDRLL